MESGVPHYKDNTDLKATLYKGIGLHADKYSAADICFICDITGTMEKFIGVIKKTLREFVNSMQSTINTDPRVAFIGFRDKEDDKQIEFKDFTTNPKELVEFIRKVKCMGGGDVCEDLVTPLKYALGLDWRSDLIYVYLLVEAPAHGRSYHDDAATDDYLDDDKNKELEKLVYHYKKNKINLVVLRCNSQVDLTISKMKEYYDLGDEKLIVIDMEKKDILKEDFTKNFVITVSKEFSDSYSSSRYSNFRVIKNKKIAMDTIDSDQNLDFGKKFEGVVHTGMVKNLDFATRKFGYKIEFTKSAKFNCIIGAVQLGTGTFAECHPLKVDEDSNYVAKLPKTMVEDVEKLKPDVEGSLLAKYFAEKFNFYLKKTEKKSSPKSINVLSLVIIENLGKAEVRRARVFLAQKLLGGEYMKFNNNYGWVNSNPMSANLLAQAFSHFTFEYSMGTMIVVDIQGITEEEGNLSLTDPAIHSMMYKEHFGETNHGKLGILRFFKTHKCNEYCKRLYLTDLRNAEQMKALEAKAGKEEEKELYEEFEGKIKEWQKRIRNFNPAKEPVLSVIEEEPEEVSEYVKVS
eukprot:TRINITY_DN2567_c0_g2_i1.p1 TRINITY_DN2567_c0_g2~~TRINITY_DN2567_c0_g2_i1.p1  ORF type:complete len:574 (+),score=226.35 TRINITY_DN2567_c0_g2_i1:195-1916(+)